MIGILVVDDDLQNLKLMSEGLSERGFEIFSSSSSLEAFQILNSHHEQIAAIVIDRWMNQWDGIKFLRKIRENQLTSDIPVIFQASVISNYDVIDSMERGCFYFITKPFTKKVLTGIVQLAVNSFINLKRLKEELTTSLHSSLYLTKAEFQIRDLQEVSSVATALSHTCQEPEKVVIGFYEILNNSIEHGNLGITFEEKTILTENDKLLEEIEYRKNLEQNRDKIVSILFNRKPKFNEYYIKDEGLGFEWKKYLDPEYVTKYSILNHGRGIYLANKMSFDSLHYEGSGNTAVIRINTN
jgi:CheY-like chemotaxis protein